MVSDQAARFPNQIEVNAIFAAAAGFAIGMGITGLSIQFVRGRFFRDGFAALSTFWRDFQNVVGDDARQHFLMSRGFGTLWFSFGCMIICGALCAVGMMPLVVVVPVDHTEAYIVGTAVGGTAFAIWRLRSLYRADARREAS